MRHTHKILVKIFKVNRLLVRLAVTWIIRKRIFQKQAGKVRNGIHCHRIAPILVGFFVAQ